MTVKKHHRWAPVLALTLVTGCAAKLPNPLGMPAASQNGAEQGAQADANRLAPLPASATGLFFVIRWEAQKPGYQTLAIPADAQLVVTVKSKAGVKLEEKTFTHPGTSNVTTATFNLDPTEQLVDVQVVAWQSGKITMRGEAKDVPVRENTATPVGITLAAERDNELDVRVEQHLKILKDLQGYVGRFATFVNFNQSSEVASFYTLENAQSFFKQFPPQGFTAFEALPATDVFNDSTPVTLAAPNFSLSLLAGGTPGEITWPGYKAAYAFTRTVNGPDDTRSAELAVSQPDKGTSGDNITLTATATAPSWKDDPYLHGVAPVTTGESQGTRSVTVLGGQAPTELKRAMLSVRVVPGGSATDSAAASMTFEDLAPPSGTAPGDVWWLGYMHLSQFPSSGLVALMTGYAAPAALSGLPGHLLTPWFSSAMNRALHVTATGHTPSAAATSDIRIEKDRPAFTLASDVRLRDKAGQANDFKLALTASYDVTRNQYGNPMLNGFQYDFTLDDLAAKLQLKDARIKTTHPLEPPVLTGTFVDLPTGTPLATFEAPLDKNLNRLTGWPRIKLTATGEEFVLTPAVVTGESTGSVSVNVE